ncbi:dUTP diphosphatase [Phyllobacterium myrsinacearum]|uniref:Deoxyuridine 5'-triphosphate nucleotidohydrolase n=1 Tax=Phyllobacterium myrsinacearum TaxID=28101 RepID=A0A839EUD9_9HYPH|nr:dUTP diphosphatase [Phyllobacterium myrsinacearum]MBA8881798.1 dUTP pyrophosphatase [Phyllobacterium myrsinacearum]
MSIYTLPVKVQRTHERAKLPVYSSKEAAGADLHAMINNKIEKEVIAPGQTRLIQTGLKIELPEGTEAQVRSRSGLALKKSIIVLNAPGTIDSDYRGEIGVIIHNAGNEDFWVSHGDRIAQLVIAPVLRGVFEEAAEIQSITDRGEGGFGSTGVQS